jgi:2-C-methyl-D-erythritol 4-phosphate cytidylyltransferase
MVEWSIAAFRAAPTVRSILVACPPGHVHELGGHDLGVVEGGRTRAESVANGLAAVGTELVAIHDAARPLVSAELIEAVISTLRACPDAAGAIAATPLTDTIKRATARADRHLRNSAPGEGDRTVSVQETLDRGRLWAAQTPQVFRTEVLREALAGPPPPGEATDESMLVEAAGGLVLIHPAPPENLKVTTPFDLRIAKLVLSGAAPRTPPRLD